MRDIYEGQEVYYQYIGHRANKKNDEPTATTVTKVGRKWFEVADVKHTRFSRETLLNDGKGYSPSSRIILSIIDYRDEQEYNGLMDFIKNEYFGTWPKKKATLSQLRQIVKMLNSEPEDKRSVARDETQRTEPR